MNEEKALWAGLEARGVDKAGLSAAADWYEERPGAKYSARLLFALRYLAASGKRPARCFEDGLASKKGDMWFFIRDDKADRNDPLSCRLPEGIVPDEMPVVACEACLYDVCLRLGKRLCELRATLLLGEDALPRV